MKYLSIILLVTLGCTATAQQWSGALSLGYSNADISDVTTALSQSFYGGKVLYHFSRGKFSPFVSLAAGVGTTRIERFDESVNERTSSDAHLQFSVILIPDFFCRLSH